MDKSKLIFNMFKDVPVDVDVFKGIVKGKYNMDNYYEIYVDIVNYQINKYGIQLYELKNLTNKRIGVKRK